MNVTYKREMKHNYMIIEPDQEPCFQYETGMMVENHIEGLLHFHMKQVDNKTRFYYEITSKQPISRLLEQRSITCEEIKLLILEIGSILTRLEAYLLDEDRIVLKPEYIYVEPETFAVYLCLVPGNEGSFPEGMTCLLQYILGKVDHQNKESVVLAYGIYQESLKENYGMESLLGLIKHESLEQKEVPKIEKQEEEQEAEAYVEFEKAKPVQGESLRKEVGRRSIIMIAIMVGIPAAVWLTGGSLREWWYWMAAADGIAAIGTFWPYLEKCWKRPEKIQIESERYSRNYAAEPEETINQWQMIFDKQISEPEPGLVEEANTILLNGVEDHAPVRRLIGCDRNTGDIPIAYFPFIIGKQDGLVDYVLPKETVSRLHLRIDHEGDLFQITDLNSTNGTTVGGHLLETNETAILNKGDEVYIANIGYKFT